MTAPFACWRCELPGHAAAECQRPAAQTRRELYQRIDRYVERWIAREITTGQKTEWIATEKKAFDAYQKAEKEKAK